MSNRKNDLMDLHYASVVGGLLGSRPQQEAAARDAEPEVYEPRRGFVKRLVAYRSRRAAAARAETGRA